MPHSNNIKLQRNNNYDLLRIFAIIAVMLLHISGTRAVTFINSWEWEYSNIIDSSTRWGVPIFVMLSGAYLLDNNHSLSNKKLLNKTIKIITALISWSFAYALINSIVFNYSFHTFLYHFIMGHFHLWFLFMLIGLYLSIPILRQITKNKPVLEYSILLCILIGIALPTFQQIPNLEISTKFTDKFYLNNFTGYIVYFLAGYYLKENSKNFTTKIVKLIYILGAVGFVLMFSITSILSNKNQIFTSFYSSLFLPDLFLSFAIFTLFSRMKNITNSKFLNVKKISYFSKLSFGAYLCHAFFLTFIDAINITMTDINPILSTILCLFIVTVGSFITSAILNKIPIIKDYCC